MDVGPVDCARGSKPVASRYAVHGLRLPVVVLDEVDGGGHVQDFRDRCVTESAVRELGEISLDLRAESSSPSAISIPASVPKNDFVTEKAMWGPRSSTRRSSARRRCGRDATRRCRPCSSRPASPPTSSARGRPSARTSPHRGPRAPRAGAADAARNPRNGDRRPSSRQ